LILSSKYSISLQALTKGVEGADAQVAEKALTAVNLSLQGGTLPLPKENLLANLAGQSNQKVCSMTLQGKY